MTSAYSAANTAANRLAAYTSKPSSRHSRYSIHAATPPATHSTMPRPWTLNRMQKPQQPINTAMACAHAGQLTVAEAVCPYSPAVRCHAAAVPSAIASAVRNTCTMRKIPELVSP